MSKRNPLYKYLLIDYHSATPKYMQLINCMLNAINAGVLKTGDVLPSINELSFEFEISRDTVEKSYKHLKTNGILGAISGKGYFVKNTNLERHLKIFILLNKLSTYKQIIYNAFVASFGQLVSIDLFVYNNDYLLFKKLLTEKKDEYTHYVIFSHFMDGGENAFEIINAIPKEKLIIVDKKIEGITGNYAAVYQNFEEDIYNALVSAKERLSKYQIIKIIFPEHTYHPMELLNGFFRFCQDYAFMYKVVHDLENEPINKGDVFINLMENDLVILIEKVLTTQLVVGKDVGVISYNETPLKKIILNGITTISTDFQLMGTKAANIILNKTIEQVAIPFHLILRASL